MNVTFDFETAMYSIEEEIAKIPKELKSQTKDVIKRAAKIVKDNVIQELSKLPDSEAIANYDGSQPYIHMKDDIKTSVKDDGQGSVIAVIRGGKYTAYKWHIVNNGHTAYSIKGKNTNTKATHFIDNAMKKSESEVNGLIDNMISKAVK